MAYSPHTRSLIRGRDNSNNNDGCIDIKEIKRKRKKVREREEEG